MRFGLAICIAAFGMVHDLNVHLVVVGGVFYVAMVMMRLWAPRRQYVLYYVVLTNILALIISYYLSPSVVRRAVHRNWMLALFSIWGRRSSSFSRSLYGYGLMAMV